MNTRNINPDASPTVVLVHGAFADSSGWLGVLQRLQAMGVGAVAISNPLRGLRHDADYVASAFEQVPGPVLAVGHSYGGAVITNAASKASNVIGLVYVAAFAPDEGESLLQIERDSRDSVLASALVELQYPHDGGTAVEYIIAPDRYHEAFAGDLSTIDAAAMQAAQRPVAQAAFAEPTASPAWKHLPSWAVVPKGDYAAGSDVLQKMALRAGADIVEVEGSHVIMISKPQLVTDIIVKALAGTTAVAGVLAR